MEDNRNNQDKLEINVPAELLEGVYSNLAVITHSSAEFILDFIRVMPGTSKAPVKSRVVMAPEHAKRLLYALQNNVQKYEQVFGEIRFRFVVNENVITLCHIVYRICELAFTPFLDLFDRAVSFDERFELCNNSCGSFLAYGAVNDEHRFIGRDNFFHCDCTSFWT